MNEMNKILMKAGILIAVTLVTAGVVIGAVSIANKDNPTMDAIYYPIETVGSGVADGNGRELVSGTSYVMPKSVVYTSTTSESRTASNGIILNVNVKPDNAADKRVDVTARWTNNQSVWATGKAVKDYVICTQSTDGGTEIKLKCLQPFGEQITLTATSRQNTDISATCTLDYAQRVTGVSVKIGESEVFGEEDVKVLFTVADRSNSGGLVTANLMTDSVYTIKNRFTQTVILRGGGFTIETGGEQTYPVTWRYNGENEMNPVGKSIYFDKRLFNLLDYAPEISGLRQESLRGYTNEQLSNLLKDASFNGTNASTYFYVECNVTGTYGTWEETRPVYVAGYYVPPVAVTELSFENTTVVF